MTIETPTITKVDDQLLVHTSFNRNWITAAKKLGGKWDASAKAWGFNPSREERVREMLIGVYGSDGESSIDLATVRLITGANPTRIEIKGWRCELEAFGRVVIQITEFNYFEEKVKAGVGSAIMAGNVFIDWKAKRDCYFVLEPNTVIEVTDIPVRLAKDKRSKPRWCDRVEVVE